MLTGVRTSNIMMGISRDGLGRKTGMAMNKFNSTGGLMSSDNRKYTGNGHVVSKNAIVMSRFPGGFFDSAGSPYYYLTDFQGNNIGVYDKTGKLVQRTDYYASGEPWLEPVYGSGAVGNRYLFGGKERMAGGALNEYDFEARNYVASFQRFTTIDPEAEKFPWLSPYAYCNGNPINFIDPTGEEPTEEEAARMSAYVYGDLKVGLIGDWKVSEEIIEGLKLIDDDSGFKSMLFERTVDGVKEYTYAFAGTDKWSLKDWENNILQIAGKSKQYKMAMKNADALIKGLEGKKLTFTGHSLGGGMAAACAYHTGGRALTFNPAGVSCLTIESNSRANIDAYIINRDELNIVQNTFLFAPPADGKVNYRNGEAALSGHSIENFYERPIYQRTYDSVKDKTIQFLRAVENALTPKWPF